ncbi:ArsC family transcriptional regulator [candidate division TA06 bacterium]|uniref:ArsC family transcriptional regulator n=1 Tax=candidate division TA06 bacterium TaxID=2250710 RepID=A0A933ICS3_UNCT6|nr:ArsC family transcriptional regulator [candidate division TA06 bacterium]
MPIIQIFGANKCQNTRAALRFFKERRVPIQFIDLSEKGLSEGEFQSIRKAVGLENMIDTEGRGYQRQNLKYQKFDIEIKLKENPLLIKTPIVRQSPSSSAKATADKKATVDYVPETWKQWLAQG